MIKINLLPKEARKRVGVAERIALVIVGVLIIFGGIGFYWSYLNGVIEQKYEEIAKTKQRLAELQRIIDEIKKFEQQRAALEQKLAVIAKLQKEQQVPVHLLDELYLTLHDDVWLTSFSQGGDNRLNIVGSALSNPVLASYLRKLQDSPYFSEVELIVSQARKVAGNQEVRDFQITARLTPPQEAPAGQQ